MQTSIEERISILEQDYRKQLADLGEIKEIIYIIIIRIIHGEKISHQEASELLKRLDKD